MVARYISAGVTLYIGYKGFIIYPDTKDKHKRADTKVYLYKNNNKELTG